MNHPVDKRILSLIREHHIFTLAVTRELNPGVQPASMFMMRNAIFLFLLPKTIPVISAMQLKPGTF